VNFQNPLKIFKGHTILRGLFRPFFSTKTARVSYFKGLISLLELLLCRIM
jgi:hypothetical protein